MVNPIVPGPPVDAVGAVNVTFGLTGRVPDASGVTWLAEHRRVRHGDRGHAPAAINTRLVGLSGAWAAVEVVCRPWSPRMRSVDGSGMVSCIKGLGVLRNATADLGARRVQTFGTSLMPLTDNETNILTHLGYEWWMAKSTHSILLDMIPIADPVRNALVESMNIHIRGLVSFFCDDPKGDDWSVCHLGRNLQAEKRPLHLVVLLTDINKRIAHLTARRSIAAGLVHEWHIEQALDFINVKVSEVRTALGADFPAKWVGDAGTTTCLLREIGSQTVTGSSAPLSGGSIGATGPAPPGV